MLPLNLTSNPCAANYLPNLTYYIRSNDLSKDLGSQNSDGYIFEYLPSNYGYNRKICLNSSG